MRKQASLSPINHDIMHLQSRGQIDTMRTNSHMKYASTGNVGTYSKKMRARVIKLQNENESIDNQCKTTNTGGEGAYSRPAIKTNFLLSTENIDN